MICSPKLSLKICKAVGNVQRRAKNLFCKIFLPSYLRREFQVDRYMRVSTSTYETERENLQVWKTIVTLKMLQICLSQRCNIVQIRKTSYLQYKPDFILCMISSVKCWQIRVRWQVFQNFIFLFDVVLIIWYDFLDFYRYFFVTFEKPTNVKFKSFSPQIQMCSLGQNLILAGLDVPTSILFPYRHHFNEYRTCTYYLVQMLMKIFNLNGFAIVTLNKLFRF